MTKKDEEKLVEKFVEYNKKKWINRDNKIKQKEKIIEKEISGYFKPQISKSSKRLAQNKRAKEFGIITGGKIVQPNSTKNNNSLEFRFERLYNDSKKRLMNKQNEEMNEISKNNTKSISNLKHRNIKPIIDNKSSLNYNETSNTNNKISPITSTDNIYQLSPECDERTRSIINKYTHENVENEKTLSSFKNQQNYTSNGANSPCEFITWNESKYQSKSIDMSANLNQVRMKEEERQRKLLQPISRQNEIKSMHTYTNYSETQDNKDDDSCVVRFNTNKLNTTKSSRMCMNNFSNAVPKNKKYDYVQNKVTSRRDKNKNVLAYSLLDKSLDNTIQLIEAARLQEQRDKQSSQNASRERSIKRFRLKEGERNEYIESFRKMQELKVSNGELL